MSENFKEWFGKSKVVNSDGSPKILYHGTSAEFDQFGLGKLSTGATRHVKDSIFSELSHYVNKGIYLTDSERSATTYMHVSNVMPLYCRIENPLEVDYLQHLIEYGLDIGKVVDYLERNGNGDIDYDDISSFDELNGSDIVDYINMNLDLYASPRIGVDELTNNLIGEARSDHNDGVILRFAKFKEFIEEYSFSDSESDGAVIPSDHGDIYIVFDPNQLKSPKNKGTWSRETNNIFESAIGSTFGFEYELIDDTDGKKQFTITKNGIDIGMIEYHMVDSNYVEIDRIYLKPESQRKKYGQKIVMDLLNTTGADGFTLYPLDQVPWLRMGMYYKDGDDLFMSKEEFMTHNNKELLMESETAFKKFLTKLTNSDPELIRIVMEGYDSVFYHGTPDNLQGKKGIHIGTKMAATQALEARIGVPAEGSWDGTREYGKTLMAGRKRLAEISKERGYGVETGYNCGSDLPEGDYYPGDRKTRAVYSDRSEVPMTAKPVVFPTKISGKMSNTPHKPTSDSAANRMMSRYTKSGNAKQGYYYKNDAEDYGSISAVVPNESFLLRESADGSPSLEQRIEALKPEIAKIGQKEYDEWAAAESREDFADVYAGGGICHFIADEVAKFIDKAIPGAEASTVSSDFEQHVYVVVRNSDSITEYNEDDESEDESSFDMVVVDIHWSVYETGGGFTWERLPDIEITADDVSVHSQSCTDQNWKYLTGG